VQDSKKLSTNSFTSSISHMYDPKMQQAPLSPLMTGRVDASHCVWQLHVEALMPEVLVQLSSAMLSVHIMVQQLAHTAA
jgi:hypothetical protein